MLSKTNHIERKFIDAINEQIVVMNKERKDYGLTDFIPTIAYLNDTDGATDDLLTRLDQYKFPDNLPHRHLFFLKEFKENDSYIAFGEDINYNNIYAVDKRNNKVVCFSEDQDFLYDCAEDLESFIQAFIILIELSVAISKRENLEPIAIYNKVIEAAGGNEYQSFYRFIYPLGVVRSLNHN